MISAETEKELDEAYEEQQKIEERRRYQREWWRIRFAERRCQKLKENAKGLHIHHLPTEEEAIPDPWDRLAFCVVAFGIMAVMQKRERKIDVIRAAGVYNQNQHAVKKILMDHEGAKE